MRKYSKKEIIDQTVNYYKNNKRATTGICCHYYVSDRMCAVGRCLSNPEKYRSVSGSITSCIEYGEIKKSNFKTKYQGHPTEFWEDLQKLHDRSRYWENIYGGNLTTDGEHYYKFLVEKWCRKFKKNEKDS